MFQLPGILFHYQSSNLWLLLSNQNIYYLTYEWYHMSIFFQVLRHFHSRKTSKCCLHLDSLVKSCLQNCLLEMSWFLTFSWGIIEICQCGIGPLVFPVVLSVPFRISFLFFLSLFLMNRKLYGNAFYIGL